MSHLMVDCSILFATSHMYVRLSMLHRKSHAAVEPGNESSDQEPNLRDSYNVAVQYLRLEWRWGAAAAACPNWVRSTLLPIQFHIADECRSLRSWLNMWINSRTDRAGRMTTLIRDPGVTPATRVYVTHCCNCRTLRIQAWRTRMRGMQYTDALTFVDCLKLPTFVCNSVEWIDREPDLTVCILMHVVFFWFSSLDLSSRRFHLIPSSVR